MIVKEVDNENPNEHWEFIECENEIVLDLGCGRWEKVEYRDASWPTTPEYLIQRGASHVYAVDIDIEEIHWYTEHVAPYMNVTPIYKKIDTVEDIRELLVKYNPSVIKCDIERFESVFFNLTDEEFSSIKFYAVETHSNEIFDTFMEKFRQFGYTIVSVINLIHADPMKVIFAKKTI